MLARRARHKFQHNLEPFLQQQRRLGPNAIAELAHALDSEGVCLEALDRGEGPCADQAALVQSLAQLSQNGFLEFVTPGAEMLVLLPCTPDFVFGPMEVVRQGTWRVSRFAYAHLEDGEYVLRNPTADCFLRIKSEAVAALMHRLGRPTDVSELGTSLGSEELAAAVCGALARAGVILVCDADGTTVEDRDPASRPWAFHDLLFHSLSRLGRTEKEIGGTYRFKGILPPIPAVKQHSWTQTVIPLPKADLATLMCWDAPLTAAIELRRSTRQHSIVPLSKQQIGEFLFRVARVRRQYANEFGEFTSRPYPGGGACYENEFYLTVAACIDIPRGFYYYDPVAHALCLVSVPNGDTEGLLDEAWVATARQCRPQVLVTIASRFNRFNWKYASMAYAAQLKNVGVIFQTMYLVATAMNIAACGLGMGNSNRFARLTALDYLMEGSIGEFMLGRPA